MKSFRLARSPGGVHTLFLCGTQGLLALLVSLPPLLLVPDAGIEVWLWCLPALGLVWLTLGTGHAILAIFCLVSAREAWGETAPLWARVATVAVDVLGAGAAIWFTVAWIFG